MGVRARALFCAVRKKGQKNTHFKKKRYGEEERKLVALNETRRISAPKAHKTSNDDEMITLKHLFI